LCSAGTLTEYSSGTPGRPGSPAAAGRVCLRIERGIYTCPIKQVWQVAVGTWEAAPLSRPSVAPIINGDTARPIDEGLCRGGF